MEGEGEAKRRGMAAAAGYGDASTSRKKIRVTLPSPYSTDSELEEARCHGGDAAAAAVTIEETAEEDAENDGERLGPDGYDVFAEEFVEEKNSQIDGEQPDSDDEDADGEEEELMEVEAENEGGEEISDSADVAAADDDDDDEQESQGEGDDYESGDGEESTGQEEGEWEEGASDSVGVNEDGSPDPISPVPSSPYGRAGGTVVEDVIVADADALECGVCFLPLKPPIFQCERGHVVCSPCRNKLKATGKCHVCGVATGGYSRCHAMEHLVASILIRCPHAAHGCNARPAYHNRDAHGRVCPHAPCLCPGASCGFIGSTTALLDHFATVHGWPCAAKVRAGETFSIRLHDGFNFLGVDRAAGDGQGAIRSIPPLLFLLNVMQERLGRAISVLGVHPHATATSGTDIRDDDRPAPPLASQCELIFSHYDSSNSAPCRRYYQSSEFQITCTDLCNGLPNPDLCFQFVVPNSVLGNDKEGIQVKAHIVIN